MFILLTISLNFLDRMALYTFIP